MKDIYILNLLLDNMANDRRLHEDSHLRCLNLGKNSLTHNLFYNKRYNNQDYGLHLGQCLHEDCRRGHLGEEVNVNAGNELESELECHSVHVGHGEHGEHIIAWLNDISQNRNSKIIITPQGTIGEHYALTVAGSTAGIVDDGQLISLIAVIMKVGRLKTIGMLLSIDVFNGSIGLSKILGITA